MCLTIPGRIIEIQGDKAVISYGSEKREARLLDESFKAGDYVVVANKIIIERVSEQEAAEAIEAWKQAMKNEEDLL